jgi:hypothetical protein
VSQPAGSDEAIESLTAHDIRFVVLDVDAASESLAAYVREELPVTLIEASDGRELYLVDPQ